MYFVSVQYQFISVHHLVASLINVTLYCCTVLLPVDGPTVADVKELLRPSDVTNAEIKAVEMK